ncbi:MAG TPA: hypothetical protein PLY49_02420 [Opitutaceae bacterium]|jgi:hypothetical protein|nr:hypothetical protein [Opitutaceae bacterium]
MTANDSLILAWLEQAHTSLIEETPPPKFLQVSYIFSACDLLGHYIRRHLKATEVGLCGFESFTRPGDSERIAFRRHNDAQKRRGILLKMTSRLDAVLLKEVEASDRWGKVLVAEPHFGIGYQSRLLALWEETSVAEKFLLLGGEAAAREECGNLTRKEISELAVIICGRGTLRSGQRNPDAVTDARLIVSIDQLKNARKKVANLQTYRLCRYSFPLVDTAAPIPVFFGGLQRRASWIGKT